MNLIHLECRLVFDLNVSGSKMTLNKTTRLLVRGMSFGMHCGVYLQESKITGLDKRERFSI